jgi:SynChlorMet cassette protein ScmD
MTLDDSRPVANPLVVLREEFDDWAVLFDPDTGEGYGLNPVSVFIWKRLDGRHTVEDIMTELRSSCEDAPDDAQAYIGAFIQDLLERGLAGRELHQT